MGFFDDYDVDINSFEESSFEVPDGLYDFEISQAELRRGTKAEPDAVNIVVSWALENAEGETYTTTSWYRIPTDPDHPTNRERIAMGEFKKLLISAQVEDLQNAGPDDLEGLTGTLRLVSRANRNDPTRVYQNVRDVNFDTIEDAPAKPKAMSKPKAKKADPATSNPFAKKS